ncbi:MAG: T9SS type A sorting domain-containing protein [Bacteroidota bacterium]
MSVSLTIGDGTNPTSVTTTYQASGGGTGTSILFTGGSSKYLTNLVIKAGSTLTSGPNSNIGTASSSTVDNADAVSPVVDVYGTLTTGTGASLFFRSTGGTSTLNVYNGGIVNINKYFIPSSTTSNSSVVNIASGGTLSINSNGTADFSKTTQTITGAGSFVLNSGGTINIGAAAGLDPSSGPVQTTTQTFSTGANYNFVGTSAQVIGSAFPQTVNNMIVNNAAGLTLTNSTTVTGTLTLTNGNVTLGTNDLTASTIGGTPGTTKHLVTTSTGVVKSSIAANGSFSFPVAFDASSYNPVTIALAGGDPTETFSVRVANGVSPSADNNATAVQKTWMISEATAGSNNATLTIQWAGTEEGGSFTRGTSAVWHHNGSNWVNVSGGTFGGSDPYTLATTTAVTSFSPFIVGNDGALPVELSSFTAKATQRSAELKWSTATENNNHGFEVERNSGNGWTKASFISGAGNSNSAKSYSYVDANLASGTYQYRLKQINNDGSFKYAGAVETVEVGVAAKVFGLSDNYPNPFNPSTSIEFTVAKEGLTTLKVYNMIGQEVASLYNGIAQAGKINRVQFDAKQLPSGIYFSKLQFGNQQLIKKMMLVK